MNAEEEVEVVPFGLEENGELAAAEEEEGVDLLRIGRLLLSGDDTIGPLSGLSPSGWAAAAGDALTGVKLPFSSSVSLALPSRGGDRERERGTDSASSLKREVLAPTLDIPAPSPIVSVAMPSGGEASSVLLSSADMFVTGCWTFS